MTPEQIAECLSKAYAAGFAAGRDFAEGDRVSVNPAKSPRSDFIQTDTFVGDGETYRFLTQYRPRYVLNISRGGEDITKSDGWYFPGDGVGLDRPLPCGHVLVVDYIPTERRTNGHRHE
jgi:hypothetical protein